MYKDLVIPARTSLNALEAAWRLDDEALALKARTANKDLWSAGLIKAKMSDIDCSMALAEFLEGFPPSGKPVLALDVDGVLNAFHPRDPGKYDEIIRNGYRLRVRKDAGRMIDTLRKVYEVKFFTLWNHHAPRAFRHLGLGDVPVLGTSWTDGDERAFRDGMSPEGIMYAKTPLVPDYFSMEESWVWVDDMHGPADRDYLVIQGFNPARFRLHTTDPNQGLTWGDVRELVSCAPRSASDMLAKTY